MSEALRRRLPDAVNLLADLDAWIERAGKLLTATVPALVLIHEPGSIVVMVQPELENRPVRVSE